MGVQFTAVDARRPRETPFGTFPASVDLGERFEFFGWAYGNARPMFALLGLEVDPGDLAGEATIPELRRAVIRARATFDRRAPALERPEERVFGAPREFDGVVKMRPIRAVTVGLDVDGIRRRLEDFAAFVEAAAAAGATGVTWG